MNNGLLDEDTQFLQATLYFSQIRVTQHLGSGQFATVNKAIWKTSGGDVEVAVKMLKTGASEQERIKFLQEAAINGQFHHLNIVRLLGVVTVGEPVSKYCLMEPLIKDTILRTLVLVPY